MSNFHLTNSNTNILPKINQSTKILRKSTDVKGRVPIKDYYSIKSLNIAQRGFKNTINSELSYKKPGTSVERKKPIFVFPKINTSKLPGTANYTSQHEHTKVTTNNYKPKKEISNIEEEVLNKVEVAYLDNNNIDINNYNDINGVNGTNPVAFYNLNDYIDISTNFLNSNNEFKNMFEDLYKNDDYNSKKKWIEINLFNKEVFKIRLESYIKAKKDIPSFIKNEINKILTNEYLDYQFEKSLKRIKSNCDKHIQNIQNICYNK